MNAGDDRKLTIYMPRQLRQDMAILPARSVSRICQEALRAAVAHAREERDAQISEALDED